MLRFDTDMKSQSGNIEDLSIVKHVDGPVIIIYNIIHTCSFGNHVVCSNYSYTALKFHHSVIQLVILL